MKKTKLLTILTAAFGIALLVAGCGIKGPPQPPNPMIIPPINDLNARLVGSTLRLSWTPSFRYNDGTELQLRSALIYRLDEDLSERLQRQAEELSKRQESVSGETEALKPSEPPLGKVNLRVQRLLSLPPQDFRKKAKLIADLPVEQLVDRVFGGKIHWEEPLPLKASELPSERSVYAIIEVDSRGRRSAFSNRVSVIPLSPLSPATGLIHSITQEQLTLFWSYPNRSDESSQQYALLGFNVYKSTEGGEFSPTPANTSLIATAPPTGWESNNIISHQQITGPAGRFAYLFATDSTPEPAGIYQTILPPEKIDDYLGQTIEVELRLRAPCGELRGYLVLDASRDPSKPDEEPVGAEVFSEQENPLITREEILLNEEPKSFSFNTRVAADARALVLRIEPRGSDPISAPFILESVRARVRGSSENLMKNGDFDGFAPTTYIEPIERFGDSFQYQLSAVYSVSGFTVESAPTEPLVIKLEDTFPPEAPRNARALPTVDAIVITWNAPRDEDLRGFVVFRREGSEGAWQRLTDRPQDGTIYRDNNVAPQTDYTYRIQAIDRTGNRSPFSTEVSARLTP